MILFANLFTNYDDCLIMTIMTVFDGAYAFNSDLSKWQTDKVSDMAFMFSAASAFNVDLSKWKVDKLTDCYASTCKECSFSVSFFVMYHSCDLILLSLFTNTCMMWCSVCWCFGVQW